VRGMRRRREPRGQPHFVLPPNLYMGPPGRGDFSVSNFHPGLIPGNLAKTIFGVREVAGAEGGGLFWATSLEKNYRRRDRAHLVPPITWNAAIFCRTEVCYRMDAYSNASALP